MSVQVITILLDPFVTPYIYKYDLEIGDIQSTPPYGKSKFNNINGQINWQTVFILELIEIKICVKYELDS